MDPSTNWMSIRILSFLVTCMVLAVLELLFFCSTIELDDCCDIVEDCMTVVEEEDFCSVLVSTTTFFFSIIVRLVLDFVAPAGFSMRHVKIPESSGHVLLMIKVDELSESLIVISSPLLS